jgi:hypothetical protein
MAEKTLQFEIYRLNLVNEDTLAFEFMGQPIRTDEDIRKVLALVTDPQFDVDAESGRATCRWSARDFGEFALFEGDASTRWAGRPSLNGGKR